MKKRILTGGAFLLFALAMHADHVSTAQALQQAQAFCNSQSVGKANARPTNVAQMKLAYKSEGDNFYVFDRGNNAGYVIVAGDDCSPSILGYTDHGNFDIQQIPDAMRAWLNEYAKQVVFSAKQGIKYQAPSSTRATSTTDKPEIKPLLTTTWNQDSPYNDLAPQYKYKDKVEHAPSGCAATAISQVMNYHKWPQHGTGTVMPVWVRSTNGLYEWLGENNPIALEDHTLEWDKMLDSYADGKGTEEERNAAAVLLRDVAYSLTMEYAPDGSGAEPTKIIPALINNFDYDKGAHLAMREWYTIEQWNDSVYKNLSYGPIVYTGFGDDGGHSFVCDGYQGDGFFHINWGWGGMSDGYFKLDALNPEQHGIGGSVGHYAFNGTQSATFGLQKPQPDSKSVVNLTFSNLIVEKDINGNQVIKLDSLNNLGCSKLDLDFGFEIVNLATKEKSYLKMAELEQLGLGMSKVPVSMPDNIKLADGDYDLQVMYKVQGTEEWQNFKYPVSASDKIGLKVEEGNHIFSSKLPAKVLSFAYEWEGLCANQSNIIRTELTSNLGEGKAKINIELQDSKGNVIAKGKDHNLVFSIYKGLYSLIDTLEVGNLNEDETYQLLVYMDDNCFFRNAGLEVITSVFKVIEPLKVVNVDADGRFNVNSDGLLMTMKVANQKHKKVKGYQFIYTGEDGTTSHPVLYDDEIDDDVLDLKIAIERKTYWGMWGYTDDFDSELQIKLNTGDFLYPLYPLDKSTCTLAIYSGPTTAIKGVETVPSADASGAAGKYVYAIDGKLVNTTGNIEGLAKGIYVKNGKKIVVTK